MFVRRYCHSLSDFRPTELEQIRQTLIKDAHILANLFCEPRDELSRALNCGLALIGTLINEQGRRCVFIEYKGSQCVAPLDSVN